MTLPPRRGRFLSFEGGEGAGKSTQARRLAERLRSHGLNVVETREPGGTAGAEAIRSLLLDPAGQGWGTEAEVLLFAAARADHVARLIEPALARGDWVVCDRFVDSTRAYQGAGGGIDDTSIMAVHRIGCNGLLPDRTLLLGIDPVEAEARRAARGTTDRIEARGADYHARVGARFAQMAADEPDRFRAIDGGASTDSVEAAVWRAIEDMLP